MRKVLSSAEMREADRLTSEKYGIPSVILMENAAHAACRVIAQKLEQGVAGISALILCGKGNNGGDGAALARVLWQQGADVEVVLFGLIADTKSDARQNFEILRKISENESLEPDQSDLAFEEVTSMDQWLEYDSLNFNNDDPDLIVDALFGTGLTRPLDGVFEQAAAFMLGYKQSDGDEGPIIVSLDLPSGLNADDAAMVGPTLCADLTVTFTAPKLGNVLPPASNFNGELYVESIGTPCELIANSPSSTFVSTAEDVREWLGKTEFSPASYKTRRGHALIIAGSRNYSGAAVLCGNAAMRSGVGLVTIATPRSSLELVTSRVSPEVMVRGLADSNGAFVAEAFADLSDIWEKVDSVAIGSGVSSDNTLIREFVTSVVENRRTPLVIDADGLTALSPFTISGSLERPLVLTPHEGEFLRLLGTESRDALSDRVEVCRSFAIRHRLILVLKGQRSLVAEPGGKVVIVPTGNAGLGKAGNGDTLTGIIGGFAAQAAKLNVDLFETVVAAVHFAGIAGDIAEEKYKMRAMSASDVRDCMVEAFELVSQ